MDRWKNLGDDSLAISGICEAELRYGLARAATALAYRLVLATLNARHFDGIPGLQVQDWSV